VLRSLSECTFYQVLRSTKCAFGVQFLCTSIVRFEVRFSNVLSVTPNAISASSGENCIFPPQWDLGRLSPYQLLVTLPLPLATPVSIYSNHLRWYFATENLFVLARDLARWLLWRMGACSPHRSKAAGIRPVACSPHGPRLPPCWGGGLAPAPVVGFGLRLWYSASPSMVFSLYISLVFSLYCIDRQLSFFILSLLLSTVWGFEAAAFCSATSLNSRPIKSANCAPITKCSIQ